MEQTKRFSIGIPESYYQWLQANADKNHRSLNGEVNAMFEQLIEQSKEAEQQKAA